MAGNIDKKISGHQQLEAKFKMQPVSFFVRSIHNGGVDKENLKDEKEKECHKITKDNLQNKIDYTNKSPKDKIIEVDESNEWNEANRKAHEMMNEMINNKQQGIAVVAKNLDELAKSSNQIYQQQNIPFSMMINSNKYMKKKLIIGQYSICSFHSKKITFDNITIDGCVYAIDCVIDGIGKNFITQQLIFTKKSVIRCRFSPPVFACSWPIDPKKLMKSGIDLLGKFDLNKVIKSYFEKGDYDKSIEYSEKSLKIFLDKLGHYHPKLVISYNNLGIAYRIKEEYDKAIECHEKSLKILFDKSEYDHVDAIEYHEKSLKISLSNLGSEHIDIAHLYNNLGLLYFKKREYNKAAEYFEQSLKIFLDKLEHDHPNVADAYNILGYIYDKKREDNKAIKYYEASLNIYLSKLGYDHSNVAILYNNLGVLYLKKGEYNKTIEYLENALKINLNKLGPSHDIAYIYRNLGSSYDMKGEDDKASECHEKSLQIMLGILGSDHHDIAAFYNSLGDIYYKKGEYDKAIEYYEKDLKISLNKLKPDHIDVNSIYNSARAAYDRNEVNKLIEYHEKSVKFQSDKVGSDISYFVVAHKNAREYAKEAKSFEASFDINLETLGYGYIKIANIYNNMTYIYYSKREYDKAMKLGKEALNLRLNILDPNHKDISVSYDILGDIYYKKEDKME
ncbi:hypothetical protein RFI_26762, partial [Reticulomyxa filosa]